MVQTTLEERMVDCEGTHGYDIHIPYSLQVLRILSKFLKFLNPTFGLLNFLRLHEFRRRRHTQGSNGEV